MVKSRLSQLEAMEVAERERLDAELESEYAALSDDDLIAFIVEITAQHRREGGEPDEVELSALTDEELVRFIHSLRGSEGLAEKRRSLAALRAFKAARMKGFVRGCKTPG